MVPSTWHSWPSLHKGLSLQAAERQAAQAVADNAAIAQEVEQMRSALARLQEEHDRAAAAGRILPTPQHKPVKVT
jgi:hypothetical protein